jgi:hypothetical protein
MMTVLLVLAVIYGVGYACFAFWDGGPVTRTLVLVIVCLLIWAGWVLNHTHVVTF